MHPTLLRLIIKIIFQVAEAAKALEEKKKQEEEMKLKKEEMMDTDSMGSDSNQGSETKKNNNLTNLIQDLIQRHQVK